MIFQNYYKLYKKNFINIVQLVISAKMILYMSVIYFYYIVKNIENSKETTFRL